MVTICRVFTP